MIYPEQVRTCQPAEHEQNHPTDARIFYSDGRSSRLQNALGPRTSRMDFHHGITLYRVPVVSEATKKHIERVVDRLERLSIREHLRHPAVHSLRHDAELARWSVRTVSSRSSNAVISILSTTPSRPHNLRKIIRLEARAAY